MKNNSTTPPPYPKPPVKRKSSVSPKPMSKMMKNATSKAQDPMSYIKPKAKKK